jgi:nuclear protein localization family protein 4
MVQKIFTKGYYAEDPNYVGGVRCIIEAIYEPPQKGSINDVELLNDPL